MVKRVLRSPAYAFPGEFEASVEDAHRQWLETGCPDFVSVPLSRHTMTQKQARTYQDKFRHWRWCLPQYPMYKLSDYETRYKMRTISFQRPGANYYEVWLQFGEKLTDISVDDLEI